MRIHHVQMISFLIGLVFVIWAVCYLNSHNSENLSNNIGRLIVIDVNTKQELSNTELSQSSSVITAIQPTRLNIKDSIYTIHLTEYDTEKNTMTLYVYLDTYK